MSDRQRLSDLAAVLAKRIVQGLDGQVGLAMVLLIDEIDGALAVSSAAEGGSTQTERGGEMIVDLSERLRAAYRKAIDEHAAAHGATSVDRPDLQIPFSGERPKS